MGRKGWNKTLLCQQRLGDGLDDGGFQLGDVEGFLKEIIRPGFLGELADIAVGTEENNGYVLETGLILELLGRGDPAGSGYPVVHQDDVGHVAPYILQDIGGIVQGGYIKPFLLEYDRADLKDVEVIVKYQYPFVHSAQL